MPWQPIAAEPVTTSTGLETVKVTLLDPTTNATTTVVGPAAEELMASGGAGGAAQPPPPLPPGTGGAGGAPPQVPAGGEMPSQGAGGAPAVSAPSPWTPQVPLAQSLANVARGGALGWLAGELQARKTPEKPAAPPEAPTKVVGAGFNPYQPSPTATAPAGEPPPQLVRTPSGYSPGGWTPTTKSAETLRTTQGSVPEQALQLQEQAYQARLGAVAAEDEARRKQLEQQAALQEEASQKIQRMDEQHQRDRQRLLQSAEALDRDRAAVVTELETSRINPSRFWSDKSLFGKIVGIVGLGLGAVAAANGVQSRTGNPGLDQLLHFIDQDIDAQKTRQANLRHVAGLETTMYAQALQRLGDSDLAAGAAKEAMLGQIQQLFKNKLQNAQSPALAAQTLKDLAAVQEARAQQLILNRRIIEGTVVRKETSGQKYAPGRTYGGKLALRFDTPEGPVQLTLDEAKKFTDIKTAMNKARIKAEQGIPVQVRREMRQYLTATRLQPLAADLAHLNALIGPELKKFKGGEVPDIPGVGIPGVEGLKLGAMQPAFLLGRRGKDIRLTLKRLSESAARRQTGAQAAIPELKELYALFGRPTAFTTTEQVLLAAQAATRLYNSARKTAAVQLLGGVRQMTPQEKQMFDAYAPPIEPATGGAATAP